MDLRSFPVQPRAEIEKEAGKGTSRNILSYLAHGVKVKKEVVNTVENSRQHLAGNKQVAQICARITAANRARISFVQRSRVSRKTRLLNVHPSLGSEQQAVPRVAGWQDAIHHIH